MRLPGFVLALLLALPGSAAAATAADYAARRAELMRQIGPDGMLILLAILLMSFSLFFSSQKETETILVTFPSGRQLEGEVANTPEKLLFGLAFRETLPPNGAMLYIFESSGRHTLWTKAFRFPVDIIWLDESRHVVYVAADVPPCSQDPCPRYGPPPSDARYVLQTRAGFVREEGVTVGTDLKFTLVM